MTASTGVLARNVVYNLLGHAAPLLVAVVAIPLLISGLGTDRFGILTLAWAAIGYFSLFDFGIGRALTQALSAAVASGREGDAGSITWTALSIMFGLGAAGGALLAGAAPWLARTALEVPEPLVVESTRAMQLLALSLPFVVTTAGLRGVLEAYQHFGVATLLRLPYAVFTFLGPLVVLTVSNRLEAVVAVLVAGRVVLWAAHGAAVLAKYPAVRRPALDRARMRPLLRTGGWMTVSNVVSPLMVIVDRFFIASWIGAAAVAYYVTPYEVTMKLLIIPSALVGVLFPAVAASFVADPGLTARRADQAARLLIAVMFPMTLLMVALAPEALRIWVGAEFARQGTAVMQWLAAGVLINAIGHVPFVTLQGVGRADVTAKLHLVELPLYLAALWLLARGFGVAGVAMAWTARVALDTALLLVLADRAVVPGGSSRPAALGTLLLVLLGTMAFVALAALPAVRLAGAGVVLLGFVAYAWRRLLDPAERARLEAMAGRRREELSA